MSEKTLGSADQENVKAEVVKALTENRLPDVDKSTMDYIADGVTLSCGKEVSKSVVDKLAEIIEILYEKPKESVFPFPVRRRSPLSDYSSEQLGQIISGPNFFLSWIINIEDFADAFKTAASQFKRSKSTTTSLLAAVAVFVSKTGLNIDYYDGLAEEIKEVSANSNLGSKLPLLLISDSTGILNESKYWEQLPSDIFPLSYFVSSPETAYSDYVIQFIKKFFKENVWEQLWAALIRDKNKSSALINASFMKEEFRRLSSPKSEQIVGNLQRQAGNKVVWSEYLALKEKLFEEYEKIFDESSQRVRFNYKKLPNGEFLHIAVDPQLDAARITEDFLDLFEIVDFESIELGHEAANYDSDSKNDQFGMKYKESLAAYLQLLRMKNRWKGSVGFDGIGRKNKPFMVRLSTPKVFANSMRNAIESLSKGHYLSSLELLMSVNRHLCDWSSIDWKDKTGKAMKEMEITNKLISNIYQMALDKDEKWTHIKDGVEKIAKYVLNNGPNLLNARHTLAHYSARESQKLFDCSLSILWLAQCLIDFWGFLLIKNRQVEKFDVALVEFPVSAPGYES